MANQKISALTSASTPLAGTETLPVVQSSATKQVSVANLTAGRNVAVANLDVQGTGYVARYVKLEANTADPSYNTTILDQVNNGAIIQKVEFGFGTTTLFLHDGNVTNNTGNFVIGTSGKGIDFSVTSHPAGMTSELLNDYEEGTWTPSLGGSTTYLAQGGRYTKIGRIVNFQGILYINAIGTGSTTQITGLPFTLASGLGGAVCAVPSFGGSATAVSSMNLNVSGTTIYCQSNVIASTTNQTANAVFANSTYFEFSGTYQV